MVVEPFDPPITEVSISTSQWPGEANRIQIEFDQGEESWTPFAQRMRQLYAGKKPQNGGASDDDSFEFFCC